MFGVHDPQNLANELCIKLGRGHRDACVGTWGHETRDFRTSSMGRGDVKYRDAGDVGCE